MHVWIDTHHDDARVIGCFGALHGKALVLIVCFIACFLLSISLLHLYIPWLDKMREDTLRRYWFMILQEGKLAKIKTC